MKIFILSDGSSIHTRRWVNALVKRGVKIHLFSLKSFSVDEYPQNDFTYTVIDCQKRNSGWGGLGKIGYLKAFPELKKQIRRFAPDIVHAHFASSYGLLGALSGFHPLIISVWGYDIYDFPEKNAFYKCIIKYNLSKADAILSTSNVMAVKTSLYTQKEIMVTPFGIDLDAFTIDSLSKEKRNSFYHDDIVVGTVKLLEKKYGVEYLIEAFAAVKKKYPKVSLKLLIVGGGSYYDDLKKNTAELGITDIVCFTGMVTYDKIPYYHKSIDIFVALSVLDSESFGVAVVEAQACGVPVVVSDAGGLPEVVEDGVTGFVVPKRNASAAADAIEKLVLDKDLREKMGRSGRKRVELLYNWDQNVDKMVSIYNMVVKS